MRNGGGRCAEPAVHEEAGEEERNASPGSTHGGGGDTLKEEKSRKLTDESFLFLVTRVPHVLFHTG